MLIEHIEHLEQTLFFFHKPSEFHFYPVRRCLPPHPNCNLCPSHFFKNLHTDYSLHPLWNRIQPRLDPYLNLCCSCPPFLQQFLLVIQQRCYKRTYKNLEAFSDEQLRIFVEIQKKLNETFVLDVEESRETSL